MTKQDSDQVSAAARAVEAVSDTSRWMKEESLLRTLHNVTGLTVRSNAPHYDPRGSWVKTSAEFVLESHPATLTAVVGFVRETLELLSFPDQASIVRTCAALAESLNNALYHGNLELSSALRKDDTNEWDSAVAERRRQSPYKDRHIFVRAELSSQEVVISVRDEGPGFNPATLPDPTDPDHIGCACGRGIFLVRTFMDEVRYNDKGNEVTLVKRAG
jgi:anti-sigma regulatory factor (Ser/Thr protein kinase)